jgi:hypothetical protein
MAGSNRRTILRVALAGALLGTVLVMTGPATASPGTLGQAAAVPLTGLEKVQSSVMTNSVSPKEARVACPGGKKVVGGGGWVFQQSSGANPERLALTRLEPSDDVFDSGSTSGADGYIAAAAETSPGTTGSWWVQAYAMCADANSVPGWEMETAFSDETRSDPVQQVTSGCDAADTHKRALGTGARIAVGVPGEVVLQVARTDALGGLTRAQAHEDANGYGGTWWLGAYTICANRPAGHEVAGGRSVEAGSEQSKDATAVCPSSNTRLLTAGGAITNQAPGHVSLQQVYPRASLRSMDVLAVENTPYTPSWDFIVAQGICAQATLE